MFYYTHFHGMFGTNYAVIHDVNLATLMQTSENIAISPQRNSYTSVAYAIEMVGVSR